MFNLILEGQILFTNSLSKLRQLQEANGLQDAVLLPVVCKRRNKWLSLLKLIWR